VASHSTECSNLQASSELGIGRLLPIR
jgi:hypothetical protein